MSDKKEVDLNGSSSGDDVPDDVQECNQVGLDEFHQSLSSKSNQEVLDALLSLSKDDILPFESIRLPSGGLYYDGMVPNGEVDVRPMGLDEEKILATQRLAQTGQSIDYLFKNCVKFPNSFDPLNLLVGDRMFLLYYIRGITHGNMYEFVVECTNEECGASSSHEYDLNELSGTIKGPNRSLGKEPFKVVLPYYSSLAGREIWVRVRLLRGYDARSLTNKERLSRKIEGRRHRKPLTVDETLEENMNLIIVDVMGSDDASKINMFIKKMHARDSATIREFIKENSPGIDTSIEIECPECNSRMKMELPVTETFFRPSQS